MPDDALAAKAVKPVAPVTVAQVAAPPAPDPARLDRCLKKADELPDMAAADAEAWMKRGGGDEARMCRAFAQAGRGMHEDAAREFWALASHAKVEPAKAAAMDKAAGQEFLRAGKSHDAELRYGEAVKLNGNDAEAWGGLAAAQIAGEFYWEATESLNHAIALAPRDVVLYRQRGRAWLQLGNDKQGAADMTQAAILAGDKVPSDDDGEPDAPKPDTAKADTPN